MTEVGVLKTKRSDGCKKIRKRKFESFEESTLRKIKELLIGQIAAARIS